MIRRLLAKPWLRFLGYPAFFGLALIAAAYLTFPYDVLRARLVAEAQSRAGLTLEIGKVRISGLTGMKFTDVALVLDAPAQAAVAEGGADAGEEGAEPPPPAGPQKVMVDAITVRAEPLALLRGARALSFDVDAWGGTMEGRFESGKDKQTFRARAEKLILGRSPLKLLAGVDLDGQLTSAVVEIESEGKDFSKANGKVELKGEGFTLNGGEIQHFELPRIVLGTLDAKIPVEAGKATFEAFTLAGSDLDAEVEGFIRLAPKIGASALNGKLKLKPADEWWAKNEMLKNMANFGLPAGKDGFRTINLFGQLQKPSFRPQK